MSSHATNTAPLPAIMIEPLVRAALLEDLGRAGDITTNAIVPADARATTLLSAGCFRRPSIDKVDI
jgi:nicotinate-nucleotide pyrophosphorylase (carboxylating)